MGGGVCARPISELAAAGFPNLTSSFTARPHAHAVANGDCAELPRRLGSCRWNHGSRTRLDAVRGQTGLRAAEEEWRRTQSCMLLADATLSHHSRLRYLRAPRENIPGKPREMLSSPGGLSTYMAKLQRKAQKTVYEGFPIRLRFSRSNPQLAFEPPHTGPASNHWQERISMNQHNHQGLRRTPKFGRQQNGIRFAIALWQWLPGVPAFGVNPALQPAPWTIGIRGSDGRLRPRTGGSDPVQNNAGVIQLPREKSPTRIEKMADNAVAFIKARGSWNETSGDVLRVFDWRAFVAPGNRLPGRAILWRRLVWIGTGPGGGGEGGHGTASPARGGARNSSAPLMTRPAHSGSRAFHGSPRRAQDAGREVRSASGYAPRTADPEVNEERSRPAQIGRSASGARRAGRKFVRISEGRSVQPNIGR